jgi:hypothetical protein
VIAALSPGHEGSVALTVGFRPRAVQFDAAGAHAFVITEDGVSVIDLADAIGHGPRIVPPIAVAAPGVSPDDLEVQVVATGNYAAVRQAGHAGVRVVVGAPARARPRAPPPCRPISTWRPTARGSTPWSASRHARGHRHPRRRDRSSGGVVDLAPATVGSLVWPTDRRCHTNATLDPHVRWSSSTAPAFRT